MGGIITSVKQKSAVKSRDVNRSVVDDVVQW